MANRKLTTLIRFVDNTIHQLREAEAQLDMQFGDMDTDIDDLESRRYLTITIGRLGRLQTQLEQENSTL